MRTLVQRIAFTKRVSTPLGVAVGIFLWTIGVSLIAIVGIALGGGQ